MQVHCLFSHHILHMKHARRTRAKAPSGPLNYDPSHFLFKLRMLMCLCSVSMQTQCYQNKSFLKMFSESPFKSSLFRREDKQHHEMILSHLKPVSWCHFLEDKKKEWPVWKTVYTRWIVSQSHVLKKEEKMCHKTWEMHLSLQLIHQRWKREGDHTFQALWIT